MRCAVAIVTVVAALLAPPRDVALGAGLMLTLSGAIAVDPRVARPEGDDLHLVAAAEVAKRDRLHLVDRRLARRDVGVISCWLRCEKYAVAVRLHVVRQADARIGHDRLAAARLDRGRTALRFPPEQLSWLPLNVWLPANWWPISWAT